MHAYFLNFGNAEIPVLYQVQRLRDGRSYATRTVLATQQGVPIFTLTGSFCHAEPDQPIRQMPLPRWPLDAGAHGENVSNERTPQTTVSGRGKIPEPEDCDATEEVLMRALAAAKNLPKKLQELSVLHLRDVEAAPG